MKLTRALFLLLSLLASMTSLAQSPTPPDRSRENLMVVVRESVGANRPDDAFTPIGKGKATLPDGRVIEMELASWDYIGDIHIRFVFDGPQIMINATPQDLSQLGLKGVDEALALAMANIKRVYGEPSAKPWEGGLMQVKGKSPDLDSSYFLDRSYWQSLLKEHPDGLVVPWPNEVVCFTRRSQIPKQSSVSDAGSRTFIRVASDYGSPLRCFSLRMANGRCSRRQ